MQRNVLLFALLSLAVLLGSQLLLRQKPAPPITTDAPAAAPSTAATEPTASAVAPTAESPNTQQTPSAPARDVVVENDDVRAVFTTRGGVLRSWRLKHYHDPAGQPLELIPQQVPADAARPFSLVLDDQAATRALDAAAFSSSADNLSLDRGVQSLTFDAGDVAGLEAHKTFTFDPS